MPRNAAVGSLRQAARMIKQMEGDLSEGPSLREAGRRSLQIVLEEHMQRRVAVYLERIAGQDLPDRRNGTYSRHLLTAIGDIELHVPRTRRYSAVDAITAYARRERDVNRLILACFVLGLSTRKVSAALLTILGEPISPSTVSRVGKTLDASVSAFHERPLADQFRVLILDGVVLSRKTGAGAVRRPVLVALGIRPDGRKEIIDFKLAGSESEAEWEQFLTDLYRRGLSGQSLQTICVDGGKGLLAALATVYHGIPVQRCWAHKTRNILDKIRIADRDKAKRDLHRITHAGNKVAARRAARRFADRWQDRYPSAVACLRADLDELLVFLNYKDEEWRIATRTTNAIERRFREVRRRTRPMGVFSDKTSIERILYAVFSYENQKEKSSTPFLLTQNS